MSYELLKKVFFKFQPETAHDIADIFLSVASKLPLKSFVDRNLIIDYRLRQNYFGQEFVNPIGLAAGFDKNGTMNKSLFALGFSHMEIGTVTRFPQDGNDKPRLFRFVKEESIQNRMGFNNEGAYKIAKRVKKFYPLGYPIGINIGRNKMSQNPIEDYIFLIKSFHKICDYLVVNVSSPNTPNLRDLQNEAFIKALFKEAKTITNKPILLKIAPDLKIKTAISLSQEAITYGASGIIATNTTSDYSLLNAKSGGGGLSGKVLQEKSYIFFKDLARELFGKTILVSVGGIDSGKEAYRRIRAGANLIQLYTALIFKGYNLVRDMNLELLELLEKDGFNSITEAIGVDL